MGMANVTCEGGTPPAAAEGPTAAADGVLPAAADGGAAGCTCDAQVIDAHHASHTSVPTTHQFSVSAAAECTLRIALLPRSTSSEHRFKLLGLRVGEEELVQTAAVEEAAAPGSAPSGSGSGDASRRASRASAADAERSASALDEMCRRWRPASGNVAAEVGGAHGDLRRV
eukprot:1161894-Prymnesium_polylepis.1